MKELFEKHKETRKSIIDSFSGIDERLLEHIYINLDYTESDWYRNTDVCSDAVIWFDINDYEFYEMKRWVSKCKKYTLLLCDDGCDNGEIFIVSNSHYIEKEF